MTDDDRMNRATRAQEVLGNKAFMATIESLEVSYIQAWKNAKTVEAREDAFRYVQLCKKFERDLQSVVLDGQLVGKRVKELEGRKSWLA